MLFNANSVTEALIDEVAINVTKHLPAKCKFCPRSFEAGDVIVFGMLKDIQMRWLEADIEKAEPAGMGEEHSINLINAHRDCAVTNRSQFRSVAAPGRAK